MSRRRDVAVERPTPRPENGPDEAASGAPPGRSAPVPPVLRWSIAVLAALGLVVAAGGGLAATVASPAGPSPRAPATRVPAGATGGVAPAGLRVGRPPGRAQPQESRCADCHFANPEAPARQHLFEWDLSAHGREDVGCDACHGGDPGTFDPLRAHREVLGSGNPASPVHRTNLPATCGTCHAGPFVAFQRSVHHRLLAQEQDELVPVCTTCHGSVGAHLLSPRALEVRCARCHEAEGDVPRPEYPVHARLTLGAIEDVRALLGQARSLVERLDDEERRTGLERDLRQAEVPLAEATESIHEFRFDRLGDRLDVARRRLEELLDALMGGTPR